MNTVPSFRIFSLLLVVIASCKGYSIKDPSSNEVDSDSQNTIDISAFGNNAFIEPDNATTGTLVADYNKDSEQNPEELGSYFEGDILMPFRAEGRNGLVARSSRWPRGVVPYVIAGNFNSKEREVLAWAFEEYHKRTCIRFKPYSGEKDYISIVNGKSGCWSAVGRVGGKQEVNLQTPSCLIKRGTALHELMHVLGFIHEQNRHERDSYITVRPENIKDNMMENFVKSPRKTAHGMGIEYDYASVMHYSKTSFSKNGKPTIEAKRASKDAALMGQRYGFSPADLAKINLMYGCKNVYSALAEPEYDLELEYLEEQN